MEGRRLILLSLATVLMGACSAPQAGPSAVTPTDSASATAVQAATAVMETPAVPTTLPTANITPSASRPLASPSDQAVNCRSGPGLDWPASALLAAGQTAEIVAKTLDGEWLQVKNPIQGGNACWVAASVVKTTGDLGAVQVVAAPLATQVPTFAAAYVTDVSVSVWPRKISLPGCTEPIQALTATATIEVSGPMRVQWHFETDQNGALPSHTANFNKAGTKSVSQVFTPAIDPGQWRVELFIDGISLKGTTSVAFYKIVC